MKNDSLTIEKNVESFFGVSSSKIVGICHEIHLIWKSCHNLKQVMEGNLQEREKLFSKEKSQLKNLTKRLDTTNEELKKTRRDRHRVDQETDYWTAKVDSILGNIEIFFGAIFSSYSPNLAKVKETISHNKAQLATFDQELSHLDKKRKKEEMAIDQMSQPLDSLDFAIESLQERLEDYQSELTELNSAIDEAIVTTILNSTPLVWKYKLKKMKIEGSNDLLKNLFMMKRLLVEQHSLNNIPELTKPPRIPLNVPQLKEDVKGCFSQNTNKIKGAIAMRGRGSAHKKVRSGKNTRWKKIKVNFSGSLFPSFKIKARKWAPKAMSKRLAEVADTEFTIAMTQQRSNKLTPAKRKVDQEVQAGLQAVRMLLGLS